MILPFIAFAVLAILGLSCVVAPFVTVNTEGCQNLDPRRIPGSLGTASTASRNEPRPAAHRTSFLIRLS